MEHKGGTSLMDQWRRLWAPKAGGPGSSPGQGTRPCMSQLRPGTEKQIIKNKLKKKNENKGAREFNHMSYPISFHSDQTTMQSTAIYICLQKTEKTFEK